MAASYTIQYIFRLVDQFTPLVGVMVAAAGRMKSAMAAAGAAMATMAGGALAAGAAIGGLAVGVGVLAAALMVSGVGAAASFEAEMTNVRKVAGITRAEMVAYGKDFLDVGVETGRTAEQIAKIAAAGARMGIRGQAPLKQFSETVAKVAVAWDGVSESVAGSQLARLNAKFFSDLKPEDAQKSLLNVADAINEIGNRSALEHPELLKYFDNVSADARRFGLTAHQTAAYGGSALVTGQPSGLLQGTRASMTFSRLMGAAAKPKKSQVQALASLGLTSRMWGKMITTNAQDALLYMYEKLGTMNRIKRQQTMFDLLGDKRSARQMGAIADQLNEYKRQLSIVDDVYAERFSHEKEFMDWLRTAYPEQAKLLERTRKSIHTGSVEREFKNRSETLNFAMSRLSSSWRRLQILMATPLLPYLSGFVREVAGALSVLGDFAKGNEELVQNFAFGGTLAGILAVGAGLTSLIAWATGASSSLAVLFALAKGGIYLGIAVALIGAGAWLMTGDNWSRLKQAFADPINVQMIFPEAPDWLKWIMSTPGKISNAASWFSAPTQRFWESMGLADEWASERALIGGLGFGNGLEVNRHSMNGNWGSAADRISNMGFGDGLSPNMTSANGNIAQPIQVESSVRGQIDPLQVSISAPGSIPLTVNGAVVGQLPVAGSSNAPRGVSVHEAGASSEGIAP